MTDLNIEYLPVSELIPYESNARTHSDEQVDQIVASMLEFGFTNPVLIDSDLGVIAGHGRITAAKQMGLSEVPTICLDHLTDDQKRAYILADNKLALNAGWDEQLLAIELEGLAEAGFDVGLTGFSEEEANALVATLIESTDGLTDEDDVPEVPEDPVTVLGDIWLMDKHRLMCGDSLSTDSMDLLMQGKVADMVFTDPPYGISYQSNMRTKTDKFAVLENDDVVLDIAPTLEIYSTGWMFIWTAWKVLDKWIAQTEAFGYPTNMVVWSKGGGGIGDLKKTFSTDYEVALVFHRGAELKGKRIGSVWSIGKDRAAEYKHPTQKPVELAVEAIDKTTSKLAMVLDIFGGSGSTLIACEKTNRISRIAELSEAYNDVIVTRWQDYTGKEATLESTGQTFAEVAAERG